MGINELVNLFYRYRFAKYSFSVALARQFRIKIAFLSITATYRREAKIASKDFDEGATTARFRRRPRNGVRIHS